MVLRQTDRFPPNPVALFAKLAAGFTRIRDTGQSEPPSDKAWIEWTKSESERIDRMEERYTNEEAWSAYQQKAYIPKGLAEWYFRMVEREAERRGDPDFVRRHQLLFGKAVLDQRSKRRP